MSARLDASGAKIEDGNASANGAEADTATGIGGNTKRPAVMAGLFNPAGKHPRYPAARANRYKQRDAVFYPP